MVTVLEPGTVVEINGQRYELVNLRGPDMYTSRFNCLVKRIVDDTERV